MEKTEEYPEIEDNTYAKMIRGSKLEPPFFTVPSNLYKFSETALGIYFKDHKPLWKILRSKRFKDVNGHEIDMHETEAIILIPVDRFNEIQIILFLIRKKILKTPLSEKEWERAAHLRGYRNDIVGKIEPKSSIGTVKGNQLH